MRKTETTQLEIGGAFIEDLVIDPKSRDDIPALLLGLQHLHADPVLRRRLFALLESEACPGVRRDTGRPGMDLWSMLVLAVLKQGLDCDFDRLVHIANHDGLVRQMLGHGHCGPEYGLQTVIDNVSLLGPELLGRIGGLVVESGHRVAGKKPGEPLRGRVDSFCVETDTRYPTDVGLLWDAMRCTIRHAARLSRELWAFRAGASMNTSPGRW
ncbi:MAG: hypothetical protein OXD44_02780 [Gammaproteobacteria bacterium]|nr:hypothetical protein [Gammaproteobacteria bacterium]